MREDLQHLLVERERIGSKNPSKKTAQRLKPVPDYDDDFDPGPGVLPSGRGRHRWADQKELNENLRPLHNFLLRSVGKSWNKVYSEIREQVDPRRAIGFHVLQHLKQMVEEDVVVIRSVPYLQRGGKESMGLYVDPKTGILRNHQRPKRVAQPKPVDCIHWRDNLWFKQKTLLKRAECGCVTFTDAGSSHRYIKIAGTPVANRRWVCVHGNAPVPQQIWYLIEYGQRRPDDVYRVVHFCDADAARYGVMEPGQSHTLYYRDVPDQLRRPYELRKKVPNRKELQALRDLLK